MTPFPAVVALAVGLLSANQVSGQADDAGRAPTLEWWGVVTRVTTAPAGALVTPSSTALLFDGAVPMRGARTLMDDTTFPVGMMGGMTIMWGHIGLQMVLDRSAGDVGARIPDQQMAWPEPAPSLTLMAMAFNPAVRAGQLDRVSVTLSGGPAFYRLGGDVQLGSMAFHFAPAHVVGFDVGAEVSASLGRHAAVLAGYRYFGGSDAEIAVTSAGALHADDALPARSIADVGAPSARPPVRMSVSCSRLFIAVRFTP